jgi:type I restriction enzyme S subunit
VRKVKLSEVTKLSKGKQINGTDLLENGEYDFLNGGINPSGKWNEFNVTENSIAISEGGNSCGYVNFMTNKFWCGAHCYYLFDIIGNTKYLYYNLKFNENKIQNLRSGACMPNIKKNDILNFEFNYDNNQENQNKIVEKLDLITTMIGIKKNQLMDLDDLIKSQFVEMFDNIENKIRLGDCCEVHARIGWQALTKNEHMENGEYMLITGTDFKNNEINYETCVYVSKERYEMDKNIILKNDDILITKDGTIGKVAIVHNLNKAATLNGGVFVVRSDKNFNKEYIAYVFKGPLFEEYVDKSKTGATIKHLNQKHLVEFEIPLPEKQKQDEFAKIYNQIDKQKFEIQKSLEEVQKIQESLMNKYFGG